MSLRGVQPGAVIERIYYAVPGAYTIGETFEDWESAVRYAKGRRLELITALGASLEGYARSAQIPTTADAPGAGGRRGLVAALGASMAGHARSAQIQTTADARVRVDLRWVIRNPDGRTIDTV